MNSMDIHEILEHLPHRYPFLLIDKVVNYKEGDYLIAIKNVSFNEPFFQGHFPVRPVMPGVLVVEAMAQATGILSFKTAEAQPDDDSLYYLAGINNAKFKKPVEPGDQLEIKVQLLRVTRGFWKYSAESKVDGKVVASAELLCANRKISA